MPCSETGASVTKRGVNTNMSGDSPGASRAASSGAKRHCASNKGGAHGQSFVRFRPYSSVQRLSIRTDWRGGQRSTAQPPFCVGSDECRSLGGGDPSGGNAQRDRRKEVGLDARSDPRTKLEIVGRRGYRCAIG